MKAVIALCLIAVVVAQRALPLSLEEEQFEFLSFVGKFNKKYQDNAEFFKRFNAFRVELNEVRQHNAGNHTWTAGINEFSDLSREEFSQIYGCNMLADKFVIDMEDTKVNPDNSGDVDWREKGAVNAIKNQGQCGSCWAFGAMGTFEGVVKISGKDLPNLAEQQLVDCSGSTGNQGCNGGMPDRALNYLKTAGACSTKSYPYTAKGGACKASSCGDKQPTKGPKNAKGEPTLENLLNASPVSVAIDASSAFSRYSSGVFSGPCSSSSINHAVTAIGYKGSEYWIVRNSWGGSWGQGGYIFMKRGQNICNINNYLTVATL